ncbi:hypothetical protein [Neorhodopirellula pilleata]|uniref:hypothetical protein n=1 Tax=Neorhodopirellula pilleata TaxID=2714738 RepID=UPI0011B3E75B|nr:hypothetical protein [Neorhodopirellula pilleata]
MIRFRLHSAFVLTLFGVTLSGCAAKLATIDQGRQAFVAGDLQNAKTLLHQVADSKGRFASPAKLDLAIVELASGEVKSASNRLRTLRDEFDLTSEVSQVGGTGSLVAGAKAIGGEAASMLTDDTARVFQPAGYEEVMIRTMLAMCSLVQDDGDAESYINQAALHQGKLRSLAEAKRQQFFPESLDTTPHQELVLAPYLRGVLREATHHDFDDAQRNYQLVSAIKPDFRPAMDDLERATTGAHSRPDHGVLYVFAMVGRGPVLQPVDAPITSAAVSIASTLLLHESNEEDDVIQLPKITSVKVPAVVVPPSPIAAITVASQGSSTMTFAGPTAGDSYRMLGATQSLTDVAELVKRQADAERPWTIARAMVRQTGKELAVAKARDGLGLNGGLGTVFHFAATSAWTATESADTRCWGLLPREIQVLRAELPVGQQTIVMAPVGGDGFSIGPQVQTTVTMHNGRNTYLVVFAPHDQIHPVVPR